MSIQYNSCGDGLFDKSLMCNELIITLYIDLYKTKNNTKKHPNPACPERQFIGLMALLDKSHISILMDSF